MNILRVLLPCLVALAIAIPASASLTLFDKDQTTFSVDGSFNTFLVYSDSDNDISGNDRDQARVKMGFLPNWIGFDFSRQVGDLKLGGRSSFWVTINDSDNNLTESGIDTRQFYGTIDADWGQVLIGKDFTLFGRANIFNDEILRGYGNVSDTLGLIDGNGVSFGNIGSGYIYPLPTSQITYRSPEMAGFKLALALVDPSRTSGSGGEEKLPRFEGEVVYGYDFEDGSITAWSSFLYQKSEDGALGEVISQGVSYGVRLKYADLGVHASGYTGEGLGFLLGPGGDSTLGFPVVENGDEVDSDGYLVQASYQIDKAKLVGSYGYGELDSAIKWETETIIGAVFYAVNDYLSLVAEYNNSKITLGGDEEDVNTFALGGIINF